MGNDYVSSKLSQKNYYSLVIDLLEYIKKEGISAGGKLPDENTLAQELHASRPSLREALKVLEAFGIIDCRRGSGNTYVRSFESGCNCLLALYAIIHGSSGMVDMVSMRAALEASAIESFFDNATEDDFLFLDQLYHRHLLKALPTEEYVQHHIEFHQHLLKYYNNALAKDFVAACIRMTSTDPEQAFHSVSLPEDERNILHRNMEVTTHRKIIGAIHSRDRNWCKELLVQHIIISAQLSKESDSE